MLSVISPAKTLDFDTPPTTRKSTQPRFLDRAAQLVEDARDLSPDDIRSLMGVSDNIARLNHERFMNWGTPFTLENAKQSVLAFKGDVYTGLEAESLSNAQLGFAQKHLCLGRPAVRMRRNSAFENKNIILWEQLAHMVIGAPVSQSKFKDRSLQVKYAFSCVIQTCALRHHAVNE